MKKQILVIVLILCSVITSFAQSFPIGKWEYKSISTEGLNQEKANNLETMMRGFRVEYKENKNYTQELLGGEETGTWAFQNDQISFTSEAEKTSKNKITDITDSTYSFEMGAMEGVIITLKKVDKYATQEEWVPTEHTLIEIKSKEIRGLWYFKELVPSGNPEKEATELMAGALFKDSYIDFQKGGDYEDNAAFKMIVKGTWVLSEDKTSVTVTKGEKSIQYGVISLTDSELKVVDNNRKIVFIYSRTEVSSEKD